MSQSSVRDLHIAKPGEAFRIEDADPAEVRLAVGKREGKESLKTDREELVRLQEVLYAEGKHAVLIVLQAMDTGGKDGVIRHVMAGVNPQGCVVTPFKVLTP